MNRVSATELKNKVADVLNEVIFTGSETVIERYGKPVAKITPIRRTFGSRRLDIKRVLDMTFGSDPDFPEVTKFRTFGRKAPKL